MSLKSITINGFKSFADKTTIYFDSGITGIVGPNGSGKSNITEAIRWVMGEQSAKSLRGEKMQDVIFAGSDSRPPLNRAEVILNFDNHSRDLNINQDEVEVRRRLFRGGDSEFLINNQRSRLKDIVSLFMDSGLGRQSFSIISQGKVEAIFNSKPVDRRSIVEESAGVSSFKVKKQRAEGQLQETDDNLKRISDIVHELSTQVEPLKKQASIAKDYKSQKSQYDEFNQDILAYEINEINQQKSKYTKKSNQIKKILDDIDQKVTISDQKLADNRQANVNLTKAIDDKQAQLTQLSRNLEILNRQKAVANERSDFNTTNVKSLKQQLILAKKDLAQFEQDLSTKLHQQTKLKLQVDELTAKTNSIKSDVTDDPSKISHEIDELKSDYMDLLQQQTTNHNELNYLLKQIDQANVTLRQLNNSKHELGQSLSKIKAEMLVNQNKETDLKLNNKKLIESTKKSALTLKQDQATLQNLQNAYSQKLRINQQSEAEYTSLERIIGQHQGFYQGVRSILNAKQHLTGIIGAVAELINVPEKYQTALESVASAQLQSVVTETQGDARDAIKYLRSNRSGRATFLPRDVIKSRKIASYQILNLKHQDYFLGIASDLISYDQNIGNVIENIFGNILIVTDINSAIKASNIINHRYRIVTLKGDVINPGGSMTGGQIRHNNALLSQQTRVKQLKIAINANKTELSKFRNQIFDLQSVIKNDESKSKNQQSQTQAIVDSLQDLKNNYQLSQQQKNNIDRQIKAYDYQIRSNQEQLQVLQAKARANKITANNVKKKLLAQDQTIKDKEQLLNNFDSQRTVLTQRLNNFETQLAVKKNDYKNIHNFINNLNKQIDNSKQQIVNVNEQLDKLNADRNDLSISTKDAQKQVVGIQNKLVQLNHDLTNLKSKRDELVEVTKTLDQQAKRNFDLQKTTSSEQESISIKLTQYSNQIDQRLAVLEGDYQITFEAAYKDLQTKRLQIDDEREKVKMLKMSINELGNVNLDSIDEYDKVKERYEFLTKQQNDLVSARQQLKSTMAEMDHEVATRFEKMFNKIAAAFEVIFPQMFGGGHAKLILTDPDNMLETGIEIVAQPPGKKFQRLSLLSGGERALTAITLLFAIIRVQPVPFCILDEVEASLDDANVDRFANFLNRYDKKTQFIVITHRRGTMVKVNRLYGVSMQETGVSKIISIDVNK